MATRHTRPQAKRNQRRAPHGEPNCFERAVMYLALSEFETREHDRHARNPPTKETTR